MSDTDNYVKQFIRSIQEEQMYSYWYAEYKKTQLMASINIKKNYTRSLVGSQKPCLNYVISLYSF